MKHVAYNIETGEVITTTTSNGLKRFVKQHNQWNVEHHCTTGTWLFAHNKQGIDRIRRQIDGRTA